jgi:CspA family cold shock protein
MDTGTIVSLRLDRGFGFISTEAAKGGDVFFHSSAVAGGTFDNLREGDKVEFTLEPDPRDPSRSRAVNVSVPSDAGETAAG